MYLILCPVTRPPACKRRRNGNRAAGAALIKRRERVKKQCSQALSAIQTKPNIPRRYYRLGTYIKERQRCLFAAVANQAAIHPAHYHMFC